MENSWYRYFVWKQPPSQTCSLFISLEGSFVTSELCAEDDSKYLACYENKQGCNFQVRLSKFKDCYSTVTHAIETLQAAEARETCMLTIKSFLNSLHESPCSF